MPPTDASSGHELIHATAVIVGRTAVVIRGASGSGKSTLALHLLDRAGDGSFRALIGDDQISVKRCGDRVVARAVATIEGMIEARGIGIVREPVVMPGVVGLVVDLVPVERAPRLPDEEVVEIAGVAIPRLVLAANSEAARKVERALCHLAHGGSVVVSHAEA